mmetsp:Transcript_15396/g.25131  ORF Transcript_15396/g.25131 Transcript_15396/m.25131 type:complete len:261 (-) Transcript_15396:77-859(-)|eukprot:CAMPEP_0203777654 /NCGR_PEP_ID=MMETSP0099_2-20121227/7504_1 /ASSEMBLY_ACC=CAM_ASM_000209 /TAXON_ID=96639 /ORGANISM=" , Strain NY0313808BC1" /LENGTH=260 /DNA_ID=CAMNT_0050676961 /DNA_START=179 /DNA_END=961 /DNA_ORIENTATION=+
MGDYSPRSSASFGASRQVARKSRNSTSPKGQYHASGDIGISHFDFAAIESMDPSVQDGWRVIYDRECPFELRYQENAESPQEVGTLEAIKVKVLIQGPENTPEALKIELSSENDLFFLYMHMVDEVGFRIMQEQQKLMVDFDDYSKVLMRMLNSCIKEPHTHLAIFVMQEDGLSRLDFIKNMEYKFVELLTCSFVKCDEELVRQHIAYRYNAMKSRLAMMQARLSDVNALVKVKNPSLLLQLQQKPGGGSGGGRKSQYNT